MISIKDWSPMPPLKGPPLPAFLNIYWPWYKEEAPPSGEWCCPYDSSHGCFSTYEELVAHIQSVHPGERIPLPIEWE